MCLYAVSVCVREGVRAWVCRQCESVLCVRLWRVQEDVRACVCGACEMTFVRASVKHERGCSCVRL